MEFRGKEESSKEQILVSGDLHSREQMGGIAQLGAFQLRVQLSVPPGPLSTSSLVQ